MLQKTNLVYLAHILDSIEEVQRYLETHSKEEFFETDWDQAAVIRHLEIIGEACQ